MQYSFLYTRKSFCISLYIKRSARIAGNVVNLKRFSRACITDFIFWDLEIDMMSVVKIIRFKTQEI